MSHATITTWLCVLFATVSPCIYVFYRTSFPLITYNDGSVTDIVCLCAQEIPEHNTTWTTGNWTSKQWSDWRKNFTCLYLHLLFKHNAAITSCEQGCLQDVKSKDRDETETLNPQDRDETETFHFPQLSRPRRDETRRSTFKTEMFQKSSRDLSVAV